MSSLQSLAQLCADSYEDGALVIDAGESQALCEMDGGIPFIAIRGSDSTIDWVRNLEVRQVADRDLGPVHRGFLTAAIELWRNKAFGVWGSAHFQDHLPIFVTGHSQGGAVATLLAHWFADWFPTSEVYLATFGSPRVLSQDAMRNFDLVKKTSRSVYRDDLVPHVPIWGYEHVGEPVYLNTSLAGRTFRTWPAAVGAWIAKGGLNGWWGHGWEDHHISNYVQWSSSKEWPNA